MKEEISADFEVLRRMVEKREVMTILVSNLFSTYRDEIGEPLTRRDANFILEQFMRQLNRNIAKTERR